MTITNSTITGNQSSGLIVAHPEATVTITNSTLAKNRAFSSGGGLFNNGGHVTITNSTIADNHAAAQEVDTGGGGIWSRGEATTTILQNTILARNTVGPADPEGIGPNCFSDGITSQGHNLFGDLTGCEVTLLPTDLTGDPGLGEFNDDGTPGHGYIPLLPDSPAINAGNDAVCPDTDQLGQPRVGRCDIGAIEFQGATVLTVMIDIKPGSPDNPINPQSNGVIPVAILTTETFDATTVDSLSVRFGPKGAKEAHTKGHIEDVNHDGEPDLVLHFKSQVTGITCEETSASLTGETFDGDPIQGSDSIKTVGCKQ
jgi:hypothetical protein